MCWTLAGISISSKLEHPLKAPTPIAYKLLDKVTLSKFVQPSNAYESIFVTVLGSITSSKFVHPLKADAPIVTKFGDQVTDCKDEQFSNAESPIELIVSGKIIFVIWFLFLNTLDPIFDTILPFKEEGTTNAPLKLKFIASNCIVPSGRTVVLKLSFVIGVTFKSLITLEIRHATPTGVFEIVPPAKLSPIKNKFVPSL